MTTQAVISRFRPRRRVAALAPAATADQYIAGRQWLLDFAQAKNGVNLTRVGFLAAAPGLSPVQIRMTVYLRDTGEWSWALAATPVVAGGCASPYSAYASSSFGDPALAAADLRARFESLGYVLDDRPEASISAAIRAAQLTPSR